MGRGLFADIDGDPARSEIDAIVGRVPADVPVVSPQHVQPHLSDRSVSAYLRPNGDFSGAHPPYQYVVLPSVAPRPPEQYEIAWRGTAYSLFRLR